MSEPKEFQRRTITRVLRAFDRRRAVRRFLVADEVGLGKTVVARGVMEKMLARKRRENSGPLRVFYMCNSLAIAAQNRGNLLKALPEGVRTEDAVCQVDRLTLVATQELPEESLLHLYTLTPDTSMPDRRGRARAGTARERALIHNILRRRYPALVGRGNGEWLRQRAWSSWEGWKQSPGCQANGRLVRDFLAELRTEMGLAANQRLPGHLRRRIETEGEREVIKLLRVVLAKTGLRRVQPDLVILDEFQRYRDILGRDGPSAIARWMLRREGPSVLLLSATPYRIYGGGGADPWDAGTSHHADFYGLVEWLFGGGRRGKRANQEIERLFDKYRTSLISADPFGERTLATKRVIEERLRPVIARTERLFAKPQEAVLVDAAVGGDDLQVFQDLVRCFRSGDKGEKRSGSAAIAYWSSVPLPLQMLGPDYKAWKAWSDGNRKVGPRQSLLLTKQRRDRFAAPKRWPHYKLRAAKERFDAANMAVPWIAPSMPWWPLGRAWTRPGPEKALMFSRFRAVPRAVAGLMSYDVERRRLYRGGRDYGRVSSRTLIGHQRENLAFFHPSAVLSRLVDPWRLDVVQPAGVAGRASQELKAGLREMGVAIVRNHGRSPRPVPELLVRLERTADSWKRSREAWLQAGILGPRRSGGGGVVSRAVVEWDRAVKGGLERVSEAEVRRLAELAVGSPGSVVARSLERHCPGFLDDDGALLETVRVSWEGLRGYFNNTWMDFAGGMRGPNRRSFRERIRWAVVHGNLESVLDEHLWVTRVLRHLEPTELASELWKAVSLRTSSIGVHNLPSARFNLRTHAAFAFAPGTSRGLPGEEGTSKVRTEDIRVSFNSPFWPFVVASTSVGQEGLDFHAWCRTVVHWDLPGNAVDLEQREGRVDRYAGLSTRLAAVRRFRPGRSNVPRGRSPWEVLARRAESARDNGNLGGLSPWWVSDDARVDRVVFKVPISESQAHFERLKVQRLLYRLALGQPNQADFVRSLERRFRGEAGTDFEHERVVNATINLGEVGFQGPSAGQTKSFS